MRSGDAPWFSVPHAAQHAGTAHVLALIINKNGKEIVNIAAFVYFTAGRRADRRADRGPVFAIINFRGDRLNCEYIHWDKASVSVKIGLLDPMSW